MLNYLSVLWWEIFFGLRGEVSSRWSWYFLDVVYPLCRSVFPTKFRLKKWSLYSCFWDQKSPAEIIYFLARTVLSIRISNSFIFNRSNCVDPHAHKPVNDNISLNVLELTSGSLCLFCITTILREPVIQHDATVNYE